MEIRYEDRITVTGGPSRGICAIPRSYTDPRKFIFNFIFASPNGEEACKTISFKVTGPEICGGFEIKGMTKDGIKVEGRYYPPDFSRIYLEDTKVTKNGWFIPQSPFNPF